MVASAGPKPSALIDSYDPVQWRGVSLAWMLVWQARDVVIGRSGFRGFATFWKVPFG